MNKTSVKLAKFVAVSAICIAISGCASLRQKTLKSPCGPLAGMTNPCGDRIPVNTDKEIESIFTSDLVESEAV